MSFGSSTKNLGLSRPKFGAWLFVAACCLWPSSILADELSLLINGKAVHLNVPSGQSFNEDNWGLGLQYDFDAYRENWVPFVTASEFIDSNRNVSYYAGGGIVRRFSPFRDKKDGHVDFGIVGFLMHREDFRDGQLFLGALPVLSVGNDRFSLNVTYIPKVHPKMVPLVFFQLKVGLRWLLGR